jgi:hypothetical protein
MQQNGAGAPRRELDPYLMPPRVAGQRSQTISNTPGLVRQSCEPARDLPQPLSQQGAERAG